MEKLPTVIKEQSPFSQLEEAVLEDVRKAGRSISYRSKDLIFQDGGPVKGLFVLVDGCVEYGKLSGRKHRQRLLKILGPGDLVGEEALFAQTNCGCVSFARALTDVSLFFIDRPALLALMDRHAALAKMLCAWMARELRVFECKLVEIAYESMEQNLMRLLFVLMSRFSRRTPSGRVLEPALTRQDLADMMGVHIDTVIHELSKLRDEGLLAFEDRRIVILDEKRLSQLAQPGTTCLDENLF